MEVWKKIKGFEGYYEISNLGNVKSIDRVVKNGLNSERKIKERILKNNISKTGYFVVGLKNNNNRKTLKTHRLIAIHFIDNPDRKGFVNHKNGIKTDNSIFNLEWVTIKENNIHAELNGLKNDSGVNNSRSTISKEDVIFIRKSNLKLKELSKLFNICESGISKIKLFKTYKKD